MNKLFSPLPLWQHAGLAFVRIIVGGFMIYHGWEVFNEEKMKGYLTWVTSPVSMIYMGKIAELIAGIFLTLGLFTRLASLVLIGTMLFVSFFVGHGKVWYEDQHPFLFVLLGLVFFFTGPGYLSLDQVLFRKK
jgi:putative oxidoreductase